MTLRCCTLLLVLLTMLSTSACWFKKKKASLPPPPAPQITTNPVPPTRKVDVPSEPPVPAVTPKKTTDPLATAKDEEADEEESEPQTPARTPRVRPPSTTRGPAKKPATAARPPDPAPAQQPAPAVGRLEQILTDEQKNEYRRTYLQSETAARQLIVNITPSRLNAEQQDVLSRIQSFLQQASEATSSDLSLAAQLARRAELLARDLVNGLQ